VVLASAQTFEKRVAVYGDADINVDPGSPAL
jgi:hypothetical protein